MARLVLQAKREKAGSRLGERLIAAGEPKFRVKENDADDSIAQALLRKREMNAHDIDTPPRLVR
jgi:hypothetical protein